MASSAALEVASDTDVGVTAARHRHRDQVSPKVPKQRLVSSKTREANEQSDSPPASRSGSPANERDDGMSTSTWTAPASWGPSPGSGSGSASTPGSKSSKSSKSSQMSLQEESRAASVGFLSLLDSSDLPSASKRTMSMSGPVAATSDSALGRHASLSLASSLSSSAVSASSTSSSSSSSAGSSSTELPLFLQRTKTRVAEGDELFAPGLKLFSRPTTTEFRQYGKWLREVVLVPNDAALALETTNTEAPSAQLCVFLFFLRLGVPASQITPQNINTPEEWSERHKRKPWSSAVFVMMPVLAGTYAWFFSASSPPLESIMKKAAVKVCHRLQTSNKGKEDKDRAALTRQYQSWVQMLEDKRTAGEADDTIHIDDIDWTSAAVNSWKSGCKMDVKDDRQIESMTLMEGWLKKRSMLGGWNKAWFVVTGSDRLPGLLSEFKSKELSMVPEKVYQLKEYTATQANSIGGKHARFCFCISKPGKAPIYFRAGSREQTIQWVSLLMTFSEVQNMEVNTDLFTQASVVSSASGKILQFNLAAEELWGYPRKEVIGRSVTLLMPAEYRKMHSKYMAAYQKSRVRANIGKQRQVTILRSDGIEMPMWICLGEYLDGEKRRFLATFLPVDPSRDTSLDAALLLNGGAGTDSPDDLSDATLSSYT